MKLRRNDQLWSDNNTLPFHPIFLQEFFLGKNVVVKSESEQTFLGRTIKWHRFHQQLFLRYGL